MKIYSKHINVVYRVEGSTAIALGLVFAPVVSTSARSPVARFKTSILAHTASVQYRLFPIQSIATSSNVS